MRNPIHSEILDKCKELHEKKSHDYAQDDNPFSNFEYAAKVAEPFTDPVDKVFVTMLAVKLARLAELRKGKEPKNESIEDTCIDFVNYAAIWGSRVIKGIRNPIKENFCTCGHGDSYHQTGPRHRCLSGGCTCSGFTSLKGICKCGHLLESHIPLANGGRGECSECRLSMSLNINSKCKGFSSKYDHEGNSVK